MHNPSRFDPIGLITAVYKRKIPGMKEIQKNLKWFSNSDSFPTIQLTSAIHRKTVKIIRYLTSFVLSIEQTVTVKFNKIIIIGSTV